MAEKMSYESTSSPDLINDEVKNLLSTKRHIIAAQLVSDGLYAQLSSMYLESNDSDVRESLITLTSALAKISPVYDAIVMLTTDKINVCQEALAKRS